MLLPSTMSASEHHPSRLFLRLRLSGQREQIRLEHVPHLDSPYHHLIVTHHAVANATGGDWV